MGFVGGSIGSGLRLRGARRALEGLMRLSGGGSVGGSSRWVDIWELLSEMATFGVSRKYRPAKILGRDVAKRY